MAPGIDTFREKFKWINLVDRKASGEHVSERDLKKHKYNVFGLLQIVKDQLTTDLRPFIKSC